MAKNYEAHVESNGANWYSVYCNEEFPFGVFGEGATIEEAERDFLAVFNEMRENYKVRTGKEVEATFSFVKDMSAVLQECKEYISFAYLSQLTGISKAIIERIARQ